jgi:hypothetical protein
MSLQGVGGSRTILNEDSDVPESGVFNDAITNIPIKQMTHQAA